MAARLEEADVRACFDALAGPVRQAMVACAPLGLRPRPFDWDVVDRGQRREEHILFTCWPDLQSVEVLVFRDPLGGSSEEVILDARDGDDGPHRAADRSRWGEARQQVLLILRRWARYLDERLVRAQVPRPAPTEAPPQPVTPPLGPPSLGDYLTANPEAPIDDAAKATGLSKGTIQKSKLWQEHLNDRLERFLRQYLLTSGRKRQNVIGEAAEHLGVSTTKIAGMPAWKKWQRDRDDVTKGGVWPYLDTGMTEGAPDRSQRSPGAQAETKDGIWAGLLQLVSGEHRARLHKLPEADRDRLTQHLMDVLQGAEEDPLKLQGIMKAEAERWLDERPVSG
jgi:hypothetical protein